MRTIFVTFSALLLLHTMAFGQQYSTGLLLDDEAYEAVPLKKPVLQRSYENLPPSASLKAFCPDPQDQGAFANCVGWAVGYAARTILELVHNGNQRSLLNTEQAFSPDFLYLMNKLQQDENCQRGISIQQALKTMQEKGIPRKKDLPSSCNTALASNMLSKAQAHRIEQYTRLFEKTTTPEFRLQVIKKALSQQRPVLIGIECYESFKQATTDWNGAKDRFVGGHALCVVGYDDQRAAFEVMNSWGKSWGEQGFTWIRYPDFLDIVKYAFEISAVSTSAAPETRPGADVAMSTLAGSLEFILDSGEKMPLQASNRLDRGIKPVKVVNTTEKVQYQTRQPYPSGTRYRIFLRSETPAYVYVLGSDLNQKVGQVFPPDQHLSPFLSDPGEAIALPDEQWYIEMDETLGTDFVILLYSQQAIALEPLMDRLNRSIGSLSTRIQEALGGRLMAPEQVTYQKDFAGFQAKAPQGAIIATLIAVDHIAK